MSSVAIHQWDDAAARLRYFFWLRPEWWIVVFSGLAWLVMLAHGVQHAGHEMHHWLPFPQEVMYWMIMVAAMMLPFNLESIRIAAFRSLWGRRHRAIAGFLAGYFAPWLVLGVLGAVLRELPQMHTYLVSACLFAFTAYWLTTGVHKRAFLACHTTVPLAPVGWRADCDCVKFGSTVGLACVKSCWPFMLGCMFAGHGLAALVGGFGISLSERWWIRPRPRAMLVISLTLALWYSALQAKYWL